ncbi:MAG: DUF4926 domain-containing protein [Bacteroidota bacterium]
MIKEFDRIVLLEDMPGKGLLAGDIGTVVLIHDNTSAFEIEFFTLDGQTRCVETLLANRVRRVQSNEVAQVRQIT